LAPSRQHDFQIDQKLDAASDMALAANIPLVHW
jgi:hypothetical protein